MWKKYVLVYRKVLSDRITDGIDGRYLEKKWTQTNVIFKARTRDEAMKKANKFWKQGQFGMGSIDIREALKQRRKRRD